MIDLVFQPTKNEKQNLPQRHLIKTIEYDFVKKHKTGDDFRNLNEKALHNRTTNLKSPLTIEETDLNKIFYEKSDFLPLESLIKLSNANTLSGFNQYLFFK